MANPPTLRPSLSRHHSRVPGGFDTDEELSPIKTSFNHGEINDGSESYVSAGERMGQNDSSMLRASSDGERSRAETEHSTLDEQEMRRKLMDMEPSFLPELSPAAPPGEHGIDDTIAFGSPHVHSADAATAHKFSRRSASRIRESHRKSDDYRTPQSPATPPEWYKTPAPGRDEDVRSDDNARNGVDNERGKTSSPETMSPSPTAAAAARTISRVVSLASLGGYETADEESSSKALDKLADKLGTAPIKGDNATPQQNHLSTQLSSQPGSPTPTRPSVIQDLEDPANGDVDEESQSRRSPRKRPKLTSRFSSQRSSYSSRTSHTTTSTEGASDVTLGAEYALQTGGAAPFGSSGSSRPHMELSRTISLGSMASGISALSDGEEHLGNLSSASDNLDSLPEEEASSVKRHMAMEKGRQPSFPHTPRVASRSLNTPTDTVIAQHVRDVQVPGTIARDFRERFKATSPDRRNGLPINAIERTGKSLTLKEQSSTIDRLQKDNFDLRLKITFLNQKLNQRSEEGIQTLVSENVELRTYKFKSSREIRQLKIPIKMLEKKIKDNEAQIAAQEKEVQDHANARGIDDERVTDLETEVLFLREREESYKIDIEKLRQNCAAKEGEKRRLAEVVKAWGERRNGGSDIGAREEVDMWKDLHEAENYRREQADADNRKLREEIWRLKSDAASAVSNNPRSSGLHGDKRLQMSSSSSQVNSADHDPDRSGAITAASSTLVGQLKHENAELRRNLGAQTSMLTSRNHEKERLYQEIEELKMGARRGDGSRSLAGDSILDRSASRAHGRSASRVSDMTRNTQMSDAERETYEIKTGELRDQISELKLKNQELIAEIRNLQDEVTQSQALTADFAKLDLFCQDMMNEREQDAQDLQAMQIERDDALRRSEESDAAFQGLREEAQQKMDELEVEIEQQKETLEHREAELSSQDDETHNLRNDLRMTTEGLARVELDNEDINRELENMQKSLLEANAKAEKLGIELESRQGECAFLREEQDGCMLKIGELETDIKTTTASLESEKEKAKDLEARLAEERHQREVIGGKEKQEVQKLMNDLNREASNAKEESRKLKQTLETQEIEIQSWKDRLTELEDGLCDALDEPNRTKSSFLNSISKLLRDLDHTASELDAVKHNLSDKERLLQRRDALLESHGLESRKLSDLLEKERQGRRADKTQYEQWQKTHQHISRTVSQKDSRIVELESGRQADRKRLATLEQQFKDELNERNNLLLAIWTRLSAMCGSDWQHQNSLVSGHLPTLEVVSGMLPGFSSNLLLAVKTIEALIGSFKTRIRGIERDFAKDFQTLEYDLDMRIKRLDRLESAAQMNRVSSAASAAPEIAKLRGENRLLKNELAVAQKQDMHGRASRSDGRTSSTTSGERSVSAARAALSATLTRHHSSSAVENASSSNSLSRESTTSQAVVPSQPTEPNQQRWVHRLRELERRLKAEREARLLDRSGARKRLEEGRAENEELRKELERERVRKEVGR